MLTLSINLFKSGRKYKATLTAEDNGSVINTSDWGEINPTDKLARRIKIIDLNGKSLGIALNVLNPSHDKNKSRVKPRSKHKATPKKLTTGKVSPRRIKRNSKDDK